MPELGWFFEVLIDYDYASRLPGEAADGVNDRHFHPVEPRSARLTLSYAF